MIRLFVIEDHPVIVDGIRQRVRHHPDVFTFAGHAASVRAFLETADPADIDLVVLDLWLPGSDPLDNLQTIHQLYPDLPVVIFTQENSPYWIRAMMENGARAYILKTASAREFKDTVEQAYRGNCVFPALEPAEPASSPPAFPGDYILLPTERAILIRLIAGSNLKDIARDKGVSVSYIEKAIKRIRLIYGVKTTPELIAYLVNQKIL
ncbi:MAG TPA: response regulator transcription factor [Bacteroidales bacterium]|nr:response regulator transcription factor [Bacteroidales bacterium]HPS63049.1 response regulator transcription factor [Bacteroidales bacterium]